MKILVTGAAGFIGSHLSEALSLLGHEVLAVDSLMDSTYPAEQKLSNWELLGDSDFKITRIKADLRESIDIPEISECDYVFHLAAMPGLNLSWENTKLYIDSNIVATSNLLEVSRSAKLKGFMYISTSSVYGKFAVSDESSRLSPASPYGVTKLAAENLVKAFCEAYALPFSVFRLFSVYGPRQRSDMAFNIFIDKLFRNETIEIYGNGTQSRANTYVGDVVDGLILGMEKAASGSVYNLCGIEENSVLQVLSILEELTGITPRLHFGQERLGDQQETKSVARKATLELGYKPKVKIREGLEYQLAWQRKIFE